MKNQKDTFIFNTNIEINIHYNSNKIHVGNLLLVIGNTFLPKNLTFYTSK